MATRPQSDIPTILDDLGVDKLGGSFRGFYTDALASTVGIGGAQAEQIVAAYLAQHLHEGHPVVEGEKPLRIDADEYGNPIVPKDETP